MRTVVDLPDQQLGKLDALAKRLGISRAEAIRRAVAALIEAHPNPDIEAAFGIWADRDFDALEYEDEIRAEWERPSDESGAGYEHSDRPPERRRRRSS